MPRVVARTAASLTIAVLAVLGVWGTANGAVAAPGGAAPGTPVTTGSLTLTNPEAKAGDDLVFSYSTDRPVALNWVGVYNDPANGPSDQAFHGGSTAYTYTGANGSGTVTVSGAKLTAGHPITAYLLFDDGYTWLAQPLTFTVAAAPVTGPPTATGTLALQTVDPVAGHDVTFSYSTTTPVSLNWVGLYNAPADGPTDQTYHSPSTAYTYTGAKTSGTVTVSGADLTSGHDITAYFLYNDGYTWLAQPVTFRVSDPPPYTPTPTTSHFVTSDVIQAATPPNTPVKVAIGGLWFGAGGTVPLSPATFTKTGGSSWLSVSTGGVITGTTPLKPATSGSNGTITITALDAAGVTGRLTVEFPLSAKGAAPTLKTSTLSMWDAGSHVDGSEEKLVASILANRLDVVGLQQTAGTEGAAVAARLGWSVVESATGQSIVSRYPLTAGAALPNGLPAVMATANVSGRGVQLWSAGLDPTAFGPALACSTGTAAALTAEKATTRYQQAVALSAAIAARRTTTTPVIVMADLESPSASDWVTGTSALHCNRGATAWPVPAALTAAGLKDSYRYVHPNAVTFPGQTTSIFPTTVKPSATTDGPERIDYIDFSGRLTVTESHTLVDGFPQGPPNTRANSWISDRAAVVTSFVVTSTTP